MDADKLNKLGHEAMQASQIDQALDYFLKAIKDNPLLPQSHYNAGVCYMARGQYDLAIINYKKALELSSGNTVILNNIGVTYGKMEKQDLALKYYKMALKFEPDNIFALSNIGAIYVNSNPQKAIIYLNKAIKINPNLSDAHFNLGICLGNTNKTKEAIKQFEKTIKLDPYYSPTYGHLHFQLRKICDWKNAKKILKTVDNVNKNNIKDGILPSQTAFESVVFNNNLKTNFDIARVWSRYINDQALKNSYPFLTKKNNEKIRVGFLSADFNNHATAHLLLGFFNNYSRDKFEFFTYSYGLDDKSSYRKFVEKLTKFKDISSLSNGKAADQIYSDKIDILVDLKGYTENSRLEIIAARPAPIIISWLGFPGTTGANFIDYIIADNVTIPKEHSKYYSENIITLPHTYQSTDNAQEIAVGMTKENFGMPSKGFLFCSFNQSYKIDEKTFYSWIRILKKVPNSYLCLLSQNKDTEINLKKMAGKNGLKSDRLIFLPNLPKNMHLARLKLCDLSLDTFICNGHTTTTDSLWAGTPVVTLLGNHFASRVSASLLIAIGMPELITKTEKEYENLAINLANNPKRFDDITHSLFAKRLSYPLFDTVRFTKNIEKSFTKIWERYRNNLLPGKIVIKDEIGKDETSMTDNNLGVIYMEQKNFKEAISYLEKAITLNPKNALFYNNIGTAYKETGKSKEALLNWNKAAKLDPKFIEPVSNLGIFYLDTGQVEKAMENFIKLIKLNPKDGNAHNNLGICYLNKNNYSEAIFYLKKAVTLNPADYAASYHLGLAYRLIDDYENSIKYLKNSLKLKPDYGPALNIYSLILSQTCDWGEFKKFSEKIPPQNESPYINVARSQNQQLNLEIAKLRSNEIENSVSDLIPQFKYLKNTKRKTIKVGYLSRDFFEHATAYLILGLFENHDKNKFETYIYSYGPNDQSMYRKKFEKDVDHFVDISNMGHLDAAKKINSDGIDILIDLKGHTKDNRLEIMALKPAPIQVSYLGFPGTTGSKFIDYIITDEIVTPPTFQRYYSEKFAYMPNTYQLNYDKRIIADINYKRSDFNLPKDAFIFSCFNHTSKIDPETYLSWTNILKGVPNSYLWLFGSNQIAQNNLKKYAKIAGVDPKRIIFADFIENSKHLARIKLSDLTLDTFTYNGHTTTSDSLWAGVPVITLQGKHFASRVASSLLTAIGMPELITNSQKEYENLAIKIAKDKNKSIKLKQKLEENIKTKPLFDTKLFVKNLENLYLNLIKNKKQHGK